MVEYQRWMDAGQSRRWEESPILKAIREYNRVDCESTWRLREWLLERQRESGIGYVPELPLLRSAQDGNGAEDREPTEAEQLAARLLELSRRSEGKRPRAVRGLPS